MNAGANASRVLRVAGLRHRFGDRLAVDGVEFTVASGEIVRPRRAQRRRQDHDDAAVMGILQPQEGEITWRGHPVQFADRLRFGYMPEERGLYPQMKILPQLVYFARLCGLDRATAERRAGELLGRLDLAARAQDLTIALSHGNQQRVQLAVAMVPRPRPVRAGRALRGPRPERRRRALEDLRAEADDGHAILLLEPSARPGRAPLRPRCRARAGRVLVAGTLDELRDRLPRRLRVKVAAPSGWEQSLTGVRAESEDGEGVVLDLDSDADDQAVLAAPRRRGRSSNSATSAATWSTSTVSWCGDERHVLCLAGRAPARSTSVCTVAPSAS